jgi:hypothetical protein
MLEFEDLSVILPPADLMQKHEPELWDLISTEVKPRTATTRQVLGDYFDSVWQPNVTMVDLDWERKREDGSAPFVGFTPDDVVRDLFVSIPAHFLKRGPGLLNHLRGFFWLIGPPAVMMQQSSSVIWWTRSSGSGMVSSVRTGKLSKSSIRPSSHRYTTA